MLLNLLFEDIPLIVYEYVYYLGMLGFIIAYIIENEKSRRNVYYLFISMILFMIGWRLYHHSRILSKRYFEVLIIPWCVFAAYACLNISRLLLWKKDYNKILHLKKNRIAVSILSLFFFFALLSAELIKVFSIDFAKNDVINLYKECRLSKSEEAIVFTNKITDSQRIAYYSGENVDTLSGDTKEDLIVSIQNRIQDNFFKCKTLYFLIESIPEITFFSNDFTIPSNWGAFERKKYVFTSKRKNRIMSLYEFSSSFSDSLECNPLIASGKNKYVIDYSEISTREEKGLESARVFVSGEKSVLFAKQYIPVPKENRIDLDVTVKNIGTTQTQIYVGFAYYDKDKKFIGGGCYPYKNINQCLKVLSVDEEKCSFLVNSLPKWEKNCTIAFNATEDLSDVPNLNLMDGKITDVKEKADGTAEVFMDRPLNKVISIGSVVRVHAIPGSYVYMNIKSLAPGEEYRFVSSIAQSKVYHRYSNNAISAKVHYIKPLVLSYSVNPVERNTIEISNWSVTY